ncbi:unnamed protein product [Paramecium sonneborni]|uniref:Transmembrane protein n=1 Tax=Paramecium sonneborni TaxID=65129 RepID=A0A8S1R4X4_9CILI|nr:unnamed protein product [Paramecium sonneborni]
MKNCLCLRMSKYLSFYNSQLKAPITTSHITTTHNSQLKYVCLHFIIVVLSILFCYQLQLDNFCNQQFGRYFVLIQLLNQHLIFSQKCQHYSSLLQQVLYVYDIDNKQKVDKNIKDASSIIMDQSFQELYYWIQFLYLDHSLNISMYNIFIKKRGMLNTNSFNYVSSVMRIAQVF